ncbi:protein kinase domain-containing protein [Nocardia sp. CA-145437]|uniref:serine/threonine-protein kinase n=1 Tax=Nocardia sp. CA-145437 TaxID=3239980 RepID=UPI003D970CC2
MRLDPGAEFSGFTIERTLGTGGMGVVYLARNPRLNRLVALKVLGELIAADSRGRARFEREAALAARLEHPNIVAIYDRASSDADLPWISMKYVGGGDVAQRMTTRGGPLPDDHAVRILTDAARALDYAHRHGILHRDVKPGNILLDDYPAHPGTDRNRAVLTDFGIARALDDTLTLTGTAATFAYAAPERFHGATADHRADIYSLGCTFYELLTARQPFPRTDQAAVIAAHLNTPPPRPTDIRPELPSGINDVIAIALAKNPADRYPTCAALAEAATQILTRSRPANPRTAPTLAAPPHPELIHTLPANHLPPTSEPEPATARADESPISPTSSADHSALTGIPESIRVALDSPHPEIRRGAAQALSTRLSSSDQLQADVARKALHYMALHDNPAVASYAREVLGGASTMDSPRMPGSRPRREHPQPAALAEVSGATAAVRDADHPDSLSSRQFGVAPGSPREPDPLGDREGPAGEGDVPRHSRLRRADSGRANQGDAGRNPIPEQNSVRTGPRAEATPTGAHTVAASGAPPRARGREANQRARQDSGLASRRGMVAGVTTALSGVAALVAGGVLLDSRHMPFADSAEYDAAYWFDDVLAHGSWYLAAVTWMSVIAGLFTFFPRPHRTTRQALVAGFALTSPWGAIVIARLEGWIASDRPGFATSTGAHFALNAHLFLGLAGLLAAATVLLGAPRFELRWPSGRFAIATAALAVSGCVLLSAVLVLSTIIPPILRTDFLWQFASAAVLALAPAALSALHPRRLAILLTIGCVAGEAAISVLLITQSVSIGDSAAEHWILALPVLFSTTLLALGVVNAAELVRTGDNRRSA